MEQVESTEQNQPPADELVHRICECLKSGYLLLEPAAHSEEVQALRNVLRLSRKDLQRYYRLYHSRAGSELFRNDSK